MNNATKLARTTLAEAEQYLPGSLDRDWHLKAAWKLAQMGAGIPERDWTPPPDDFGPHYLDDEMRHAAQ